MACWTRNFFPEEEKPESWLTQQLKFSREQLDKKSRLCDEFSKELRRLQVEVESCNTNRHELKQLLASAGSELRAAAHSSLSDKEHHDKEVKRLKERIHELECSCAIAGGRRPVDQTDDETTDDRTLAELRDAWADEVKTLRTDAKAELEAKETSFKRKLDEQAAEFKEEMKREVEMAQQRAASRLTHCEESMAASAESAKRDLCLAEQNARTEAETLRRGLHGCRTELRAREQVCEQAVADYASEAACLRGEVMRESSAAQHLREELHAAQDEHLHKLNERTASWEAADFSATKTIEGLNKQVEELRRAAALAAEREASLKSALTQERELHEEALRLVKAQRKEASERATELVQELDNLSAAIVQKEDDLLSIQFDMADLHNRLKDQANLVSSNAEAFQFASEELADKDEALEKAQQQQDELLQQMTSVSDKLQAKVARLSKDLDSSRAAYKALDEHAKKIVARLESERDTLQESLHKARADGELSQLREDLQRCEAAAESERATHDSEMFVARKGAEQTEQRLTSLLEQEESMAARASKAAVTAQANLREAEIRTRQREAALLDELTSARSQMEALGRKADQGKEHSAELTRLRDAEAAVASEHAKRLAEALKEGANERSSLAARLNSQLADERAERTQAESALTRARQALEEKALVLERASTAEAASRRRAEEHVAQLRLSEGEVRRLRNATDSTQALDTDSRRKLEEVTLSSRRSEAAAVESAREAAARSRELEEKLAETTRRMEAAEAQLQESIAALERARLLERQASERAAECENELEAHRTRGKSASFSAGAPREEPSEGSETPDVEVRSASREIRVPNVLIGVNLDLGGGTTAMMSIAPWQTRGDFDSVVQEFLQRHNVKPIFAGALVRYLEQVEDEAKTFPVLVKAELAELHSRFG